MAETACTDLVIHHICRNQGALEQFDLAQCNQITDGAIGSIVNGLTRLTWLSVAKCTKLTADGVKQLCGLKHLNHLDLSGNSIPDTIVDEIKEKLTACIIVV